MDGFLEWITQGAQPDLDWNYALITLVFRFFAVFVVLWMIQLGMQLSGAVIRRIEAKEAGPGDGAGPAASKTASAATLGVDDGLLDAKTVAAIGLALQLDSQPEAVRIEAQRGQSAWSAAGRSDQLSKRRR